MAGWVYFVIAIGLLLGIGLYVDWRRKYSTGNLEGRSSRDHDAHGGGGGVHSCGGGCGGGGP